MNKIVILIAVPCALVFAEDKPVKRPPIIRDTPKQTTPKAVASKPTPAPKIPAGATQVEPYLYRYQDADGNKWLYRETPFGVVKMEDKPAAAPVVDSSSPVVVTDLGESVKFEKNTPFGLHSWTRKKTELTDDEKTLVTDQAKAAAPKTAEKQ